MQVPARKLWVALEYIAFLASIQKIQGQETGPECRILAATDRQGFDKRVEIINGILSRCHPAVQKIEDDFPAWKAYYEDAWLPQRQTRLDRLFADLAKSAWREEPLFPFPEPRNAQPSSARPHGRLEEIFICFLHQLVKGALCENDLRGEESAVLV